jgi:thiol-disulfide isomerase/thioredoxin
MRFRMLIVITILLNLVFSSPTQGLAQTPEPEKHPVYVYLFWGEGCPHCAKAKPFFESLDQKYPEVVYRSYEIYNSEENYQLFIKMAENNGFEIGGVPTFLIGPYYMIGYSEELNQDIENAVLTCMDQGCPDAGAGLVTQGPFDQAPSGKQPIAVAPTPARAANIQTEAEGPAVTEPSTALDQPHQINLPVLGQIDLDQQSLTLSTALIASVDGFNPCSLWVLSMLIALVLHTGSRRKVLFIGLIFLTVTAAIYALFIVGMFSVLNLVSFMDWVQVLVALVALFFALVNIKDYFWYKAGISFTIAEEKKPGIFQHMRRILTSSGSIWGLASASVVMAAGVSLVEFSCTAGFPVLWTNLLVAQNVSGSQFGALLLLYLVIYQLDELVIFGSMVVTLKASRLEEKQGRILKLFGGILMLALAVVMLIKPSLMNDLGTSGIIFIIAFSIAGAILIIHRKILPKFGIWIGTETPAVPADRSGQRNGERS